MSTPNLFPDGAAWLEALQVARRQVSAETIQADELYPGDGGGACSANPDDVSVEIPT